VLPALVEYSFAPQIFDMRELIRTTGRILPVCLIILFGIQCRKSGISSPTQPPPVTEHGKTIIAGVVLDEQYKPLGGVEIKVGNLQSFTDGNGVFMMPDITVSADRSYVVCKKEGYFNSSQRLKTVDGGVTQYSLIMAKKQIVYNFAASAGINANVSNAKVSIPANSIVKQAGGDYSGTVNMVSRHINTEDVNFPSLMPGGDFAAINSANRSVELLSFGAIEVELQSNTGEALQLKTGKEATLSFPIAAGQLATAPATIPLWYFDEAAGIWREEGVATRQGNVYVGKVAHFSTHNVDKPAPLAVVRGTVRNCENQPMRGIPVRIGAEKVNTDANGQYEVTVTALEPIKGAVENFFETGGTTITKNIPPLNENEKRTVDFTMDCILTITGSINVCGGREEETPGLVTLKWTGGSSVAITDNAGKFSIYAPRNKQVALNAYGYDGIKSQEQIINTPDANKKDIGKIIICQKEEQGEVAFTLDGPGFTNQTITINDGGSAFVPEAVFYQSDNQTMLMKTGSAGYGFQSRFDGKSTGVAKEFDIALVYAKEVNGVTESWSMMPAPGKVTYTITKYGAVGEKIEGTFSGTFLKFSGSSPTFVEVQVKNGRFSLYRSPDEE
jgi:hypothetical protein